MSDIQDLVRAGAWKGIAELIQSFGGDADKLFTDLGLPKGLLSDPNAYYPLEWLVRTLEHCAKTLNRPQFGLLSGVYTVSAIGTLALGIMNSPTSRQAVQLATRYIHIHNRSMSVDILPDDKTGLELVTVQIRNPAFSKSAQMNERVIGGVFHQLKASFGSTFHAEGIRFPDPPTSPLSEYRQLFGMEPEFECDIGGVLMSTERLDAFRPGFDEEMLRIVEDHLRSIGGEQKSPITDKVDLLIRGFMPGKTCTLEQVASALGMHARTLQRRLKEDGTSFEKLKDRAMRRRAERLLARSDVPLLDVAFMLGFSESSTLSRKSRSWFGLSPREYRRQYAI